jgi:hypothetical protein
VLLRCCAEEAHEHRHLRVSCDVRTPHVVVSWLPGKLGFGKKKRGGNGEKMRRRGRTLRGYATQVWPQQRRHRVQHHDAELVCMGFRSAAGTAFGIEGFDGACGRCGVECRCDVQSREGFLVRCLCALRVSCQGRGVRVTFETDWQTRCERGETRRSKVTRGVEPERGICRVQVEVMQDDVQRKCLR